MINMKTVAGNFGIFAWGFFFLVLAGCGNSAKAPAYMKNLVPVQGTVKVDGEPAAGVEVTFVPQMGIGGNDPGANVRQARAVTDQNGKYEMLTLPDGEISSDRLTQFKGVLPGKYIATFSQWIMPDGKPFATLAKPEKGPMAMGATNKLPHDLANPVGSKNKVEINSSGSKSLDFDLKGKKGNN